MAMWGGCRLNHVLVFGRGMEVRRMERTLGGWLFREGFECIGSFSSQASNDGLEMHWDGVLDPILEI
jgi:hypothetical protein